MPRLYAIGVGPGDPELLTRKGERILRSVPTIVSPLSRQGEASVAYETIRELIDESRQEVLACVFPMTSDLAVLIPAWQNAAAAIAAKIDAGEDVAFITIGDPLFYSTCIYLLDILAEQYPQVEVEIVPGVTSFCAAAAVSRYPLVEADERFAVIPATAGIGAVRDALNHYDTVVLLKVKPLFAEIMQLLRESGRTSELCFAERVGSPRQLLLTDFEQISAHTPDYLSLLITKQAREDKS